MQRERERESGERREKREERRNGLDEVNKRSCD
jgi:hypothetical protein